jgi:predicted DNA-binding transcriptional regulator AlpA
MTGTSLKEPPPAAESSIPSLSILNARDTAKLLRIGIRTFWRWVQAGQFPPPDVRLGRVLRWRRETIDAWLAGQSAA